MEKPAEQLFKVDGMSCQHCVAAITRAIQAQDAAAQVGVDLARGEVRTTTQLPAADLLRLLDEQGYAARVLTDG